MSRRSVLFTLAALAGGCFYSLPVASAAFSGVNTSVGTGADTINVVFNWPGLFYANYTTQYGSSPTDTIDGYDASQIPAADDSQNLSLQWTNYSQYNNGLPDYFLDEATYTPGGYDGNGYYNPAAPNNYWREWINDGSGWVPGDGASNDILSSGDEIGWVFASDAAPVPEPTSIAMVAATAGLLIRRRRR